MSRGTAQLTSCRRAYLVEGRLIMSTPPPVPPDDQPSIPPVPPQAPVSPPPSYPSVQEAPPPQGSYPPVVSPKSTMGGGTKALLFGCLGIVLLLIIGVGIGGKMIWGKVKTIADNPAQFIGETLAKAHPEIEFVSADKAARSIVFREKASGETLTANVADFKDGKILLTKSDGTVVELGPGGLKSTDKTPVVDPAVESSEPAPPPK